MVSVLLPCYNEEENIGKCLQAVVNSLKSIPDIDFEVLVWDDGSTDLTYQKALPYEDYYKEVKVFGSGENNGKGTALRKAFYKSKGDIVIFLDTDLEIHPGHLCYTLNDVDVAIGSKFHKQSIVDYPLSRRIMSYFYYLLVRTLFGLPCKDTQTGLKMFKREVLEYVMPRITVKRYAYDIEILVLAHLKGYKITEFPIFLVNRRKFGRIKIIDILKMLYDTLAVWYRLKKGGYK